MRKSFALCVLLLLSVSCRKQVSASDIAKINGYWEIEKVIFPDGNKKEYSINESYDYFEIKNNQGFRKKVMPQLDGTFMVNDSNEKVALTAKDGRYYLNYRTAFAKWTEELVSVSDQELVTLNNSKKEYHYKRAAPINIIPNGKAAQ